MVPGMASNRRSFLKTAGAAPAVLTEVSAVPAATPGASRIAWPRRFAGAQLQQIAFPLGGVGAGSISLGGRGQLRDWEIFNRPDKGNSPAYAFGAIWAQLPGKPAVARIAESRFLPPYEGSSGLGSNQSPGLPRLDSAVFTGEFPVARIDFKDRRLPVQLSLEAFTPFIPLDAEASGLPATLLRYRVRNPHAVPAQVAMCFAVDNPVDKGEQRVNSLLEGGALRGLKMSNPALAADHPLRGDFTLAALPGPDVSIWRGWPKGPWWNSPMLFWDEFSSRGALGGEPEPRNAVGTICLRREIAAGGEGEFAFILAWHFPNRTPERCGWAAPKGREKTVIGNYYCTRFADSTAAAEALAGDLVALEGRTRAFVQAMRESSLPGAVKDAAMSNLSTLCTTTSFRTADGNFHGFEGVHDKSGCCSGSCTHVWNYETVTAHLFPALAHSMRQIAFGYAMDERGAMYFREVLPAGVERSSIVAADGQMGQIMKVYLDWKLSGDGAWLKEMWPRTRRALEFAWLPGSWDADRDGVLEGVQHNTYDVEFYGPNPQCGIYYLGALRAAEEMARAQGDEEFAGQCHALFERGSRWIDSNLFNGEFYIQKVQPHNRATVAAGLVSNMGSNQGEAPEYQVGDGCLVDQLVGQYQAEVCGLGPLLSAANLRKTLQSIYRHNYKRDMSEHESVQRTFALNDESALVICDYGKGTRPRIPFPYYAEVMTGFEYTAACHMLYAGMVAQGVECIENIRRRYDGQRRNPWNEAECGHHYARAMAAWTAVLALSGFRYDAPGKHLIVEPRTGVKPFRCFWSTASGWGTFELAANLKVSVQAGHLDIRKVDLPGRSIPLTDPVRVLPGKPWTAA
jgi:uncharacterized protein (DUF608 family)